MIKFIPKDTMIGLREIPTEISLCINISNCQNGCKGCHTAYLKKNIGEELTIENLKGLIEKNGGITCVCFMGEGNDREALLKLAMEVAGMGLKAAIYSGREQVEEEYYKVFDYVKIGPYLEDFGPLNKETTNQKLFKKEGAEWKDITDMFWKNGIV